MFIRSHNEHINELEELFASAGFEEIFIQKKKDVVSFFAEKGGLQLGVLIYPAALTDTLTYGIFSDKDQVKKCLYLGDDWMQIINCIKKFEQKEQAA